MTGYVTLGLMILSIGVVIYIIAAGLRTVQQGEVMVIERFGKYSHILTPGLNIIIPFVHKARTIQKIDLEYMPDGKTVEILKRVDRISIQQVNLDFQKQDVITKDNLQITIDAVMMYQIIDPQRAVYVAENLTQSLKFITQTTLRSIFGEMALEETFASRERINNKIRAALDQATDTWGVRINRVEIQNIAPPDDIRTALEKQMRADRDKRALILEAEGKQKALALEAQGERDAQVSRAEAEKRSKILIAEGEAVSRIRVAQAEAEAIRKVSEAIEEIRGNPENFLLLTKYLETLQAMTSGKDNKVVYVPFQAMSALGSLGSIRDLFTEKPPEK